MLSDLIKHFKENRYVWIKQGEVFMMQLLDKMVDVPIAVYYLLQSNSHEDIAERSKQVLIYASSCSCCLQEAILSQRTPQCSYFRRDCFTCQTVCEKHEGIYSDWNCDRRPCEECNHKIQNEKKDVRCIRFRILSSISDQDPAYHKFGQEISISLEDFLNGFGEFDFSFFHFHDIKHQIENAQSSLERGTHFDGTNSYDATDLVLTLSATNDETSTLMNKGLSHAALGQLDKHSDENALQRVGSSQIEACSNVSSIVRTEVPDLFCPWFASNHEAVSSPLFVDVSSKDIVFCTDDSAQQLFFFRQTPIPRKLYFVSKGSQEVEYPLHLKL